MNIWDLIERVVSILECAVQHPKAARVLHELAHLTLAVGVVVALLR